MLTLLDLGSILAATVDVGGSLLITVLCYFCLLVYCCMYIIRCMLHVVACYNLPAKGYWTELKLLLGCVKYSPLGTFWMDALKSVDALAKTSSESGPHHWCLTSSKKLVDNNLGWILQRLTQGFSCPAPLSLRGWQEKSPLVCDQASLGARWIAYFTPWERHSVRPFSPA